MLLLFQQLVIALELGKYHVPWETCLQWCFSYDLRLGNSISGHPFFLNMNLCRKTRKTEARSASFSLVFTKSIDSNKLRSEFFETAGISGDVKLQRVVFLVTPQADGGRALLGESNAYVFSGNG